MTDRFCKDCKHVIMELEADPNSWECNLAYWDTLDVLTGETRRSHHHCRLERSSDGHCGYEGARWERKN